MTHPAHQRIPHFGASQPRGFVPAEQPIRLGSSHCCACARICHHIGPVQLCDNHRPDRDAQAEQPTPGAVQRMGDALASALDDELHRLETENAELLRQLEAVADIGNLLASYENTDRVSANDVADDLRHALKPNTCRACPPACRECSRDVDCECYDHEDPATAAVLPGSPRRAEEPARPAGSTVDAQESPAQGTGTPEAPRPAEGHSLLAAVRGYWAGIEDAGASDLAEALAEAEAELERTRAVLARVEQHRDALARRCATRFQEAQQLRTELAAAREELAGLRELFELQWTRTQQATALWRQEDPAERALVMPDLGDLLDWLIQRGDQALARERALAEELASVIGERETALARIAEAYGQGRDDEAAGEPLRDPVDLAEYDRKLEQILEPEGVLPPDSPLRERGPRTGGILPPGAVPPVGETGCIPPVGEIFRRTAGP